jgi:hypothetical protein
MRDHGKTAKELAGLFGYNPTFLVEVASLGFIPGLHRLCGSDSPNQNPCLSLRDATNYLLPLRVWPVDGSPLGIPHPLLETISGYPIDTLSGFLLT